jgi:hypothetical protein
MVCRGREVVDPTHVSVILVPRDRKAH